MRAEDMRAAELEQQLRMRDWAALERLSLMWREGRLPPEQVLEILALILPKDAPAAGEGGEGLMMGECRVGGEG